MGKLGDKVVVVIGGSRGIGLAIAEICRRENARIVIAGRDRSALARAAAALKGDTVAIRTDVTRPPDVDRLFRRLQKQFGCIDVLVESAGVFTFKPFLRTTLQDWNKNIESNLTSLFLTTRAALPLLERSKAPHLVNILSVSSTHAFPNCSAYCASKFGALGFTRVMAEELRPKKIRVTAVLPGSTNTRMVREFGFPVKRETIIQPEDVAEAVLAAILQPPRTSIDEVHLTPSRGAL
jgi:NAD(P)-dependent dehydrogenase (short-subunit alcohol dehydrogenase family)